MSGPLIRTETLTPRDGGPALRSSPVSPLAQAAQKALLDLEARLQRIEASIQDHPKRDQLQKQLRDDAAAFRRAWELRLSGRTCKEIKASVDPRARSWLERRLFPAIIVRLDPESKKKIRTPFSPPVDGSKELAFFFGAYAGTVRRGCVKQYAIAFTSRMPEPLSELRESIEKALSIAPGPPAKNSKGSFEILVHGSSLMAWIAELTRKNTVLPWSFLQSPEVRLAFLRGFCAFARGTIMLDPRPRYRVIRENNAELIEHVAVLFKSVRIYPRVEIGNHPCFVIEDQTDLRKLAELGLPSLDAAGHLVAKLNTLPGPNDAVRKTCLMEMTARRYRLEVLEEKLLGAVSPQPAGKPERTGGTRDIDAGYFRRLAAKSGLIDIFDRYQPSLMLFLRQLDDNAGELDGAFLKKLRDLRQRADRLSRVE